MNDARSRTVTCVIGAGWFLAMLIMLAGAVPLEAKPGLSRGKNVSVSGVNGCDCTQSTAEECWCNLPG